MVDAGERADVILEAVLDRSGYLAELEASDDPQDETRVENLAELVAVAREFADDPVAGPVADPPTRTPAGRAGARRLPRAGGAGRRLRPDPRRRRRRRRRRGHADDAAHRQGPGVPGGLPHRPRGRRLPAHAVAGRPARARGGAAAGLRRPHPRPAAALRLPRGGPLGLGAPAHNPASRFLDELPVDLVDWRRTEADADVLGPPGPAAGGLAASLGTPTAPRRRASAPPRCAPTPPPRPEARGAVRSTRATGSSTTPSGWAPSSPSRASADKAVASIDFGSEGVKRLLLRYAPVEKL